LEVLNLLADRIAVKPLESAPTTRGGIVLPDNAKEKPQRGVVVAVGPGAFEDGELRPMNVKLDDIVLFDHWQTKKVNVNGEELGIIREFEVLAVIKHQ
jgi:chaperonin GroES